MNRLRVFIGSNRLHVTLVCFVLILSIVLRLYQFIELQNSQELNDTKMYVD